MLKGNTIIVGVSSSIAAYKACEIVSQLKKLGADIWVVMTANATKIISPVTFRSLSGNPVITDLFSDELSSLPVPHITLAKKAALIVIAPATANVIGKLAYGIADDPLTTICLASTAKKMIAPAMNGEMWRDPAVAENVEKLKARGFTFVGPVEGKLACGDEDIGKMAGPETIVGWSVGLLVPKLDLRGKNILITAGGTREAIDPVRYISNRSSGKMGYALAKAARERGARVILISAPTNLFAPLDIQPVQVESASEMLSAVMEHYPKADAIIMAAAVADFTPKIKNKKSKIKNKGSTINLELKPAVDILKSLSLEKGRNEKILVGFALETEDIIQNAKVKMQNKGLDLIVANDDSTFDSEKIKFSLIDRSGKVESFSPRSKTQAADVILDKISALFDHMDPAERIDQALFLDADKRLV